MSNTARKVEQTKEVPKIWSRMAKVMGDVKKLEKGRTSPDSAGGYRYASHDDFVEMLRPLLVKHKIALHASMAPDPPKDGWATLVLFFVCADPDTADATAPSYWHVRIPDQLREKGVGAAISYAKKYALAMTFLIATGEDLDATEEPKAKTGRRKTRKTERLVEEEVGKIKGYAEAKGVDFDLVTGHFGPLTDFFVEGKTSKEAAQKVCEWIANREPVRFSLSEGHLATLRAFAEESQVSWDDVEEIYGQRLDSVEFLMNADRAYDQVKGQIAGLKVDKEP